MESVYDTEIEEIFEEDAQENIVQDSTEFFSAESSLEEISAETVVYYVTSTEEDNSQSADVIGCLVVIILAIGIACGVALGRILWGRIK